MQQINPLNKVRLSIQAAQSNSAASEIISQQYEFIYGIGTSGLSPLEKVLASKSVGDKVQINVTGENWLDLFGHLPRPDRKTLPAGQQWELEVHIHTVTPAENREVIQALANQTECGGGCGCGCGGH